MASLPIDADLRAAIERALDETAYFLLLASPDAARSRYVLAEIRYWLEHKPRETLLLALTDGDLAWDADASDFDWARTTALSPELASVFSREPRYLDLRWARSVDYLSLDDPRFRDAVAEIASTLHDRKKDDLIGDDVREHKRTMRIARASAGVLLTLLIAAATLAVLAVQGRDRANTQAALATSRALAAEAETAVQAGQPDVGLILGAQSYALRSSPEARSALAAAVMATRHVRHLLHEQPIALADVSADGRRIAVARRDGPLVVWDLARRRIVGGRVPLPGRPQSIALSSRITLSTRLRLTGTPSLRRTKAQIIR